MKRIALFLLLILAPSAFAGPADSTVRIPSAGGSGTVIATGDGWTYVLSCAHCFEGKSRSKPIAIDMPHPAPGEPKAVGITVLAVGSTADVDLSLLRINAGPAPYVSPVAPISFANQMGRECWSIGFDEMKFPVTQRPAKIVAVWGNSYKTDARPWHGRSGGSLIDKRTGYLMGVVSAYTGPRNHAEYQPGENGIYVSLPAIHRFLIQAKVMDGPMPIIGTPSPFVQPQRASPQRQPFGGPPGGT